jgi:hypothetical protein
MAATDTPALSITNDISVEAWIKRDDATRGIIVSKFDNTNNRSWSFTLGGSEEGIARLCFGVFQDGVDNGNEGVACGGTTDFMLPETVGQWVHVAGTWHAGIGNHPKLYVNGIEEGSYNNVFTGAASIYDGDAKTGIGAKNFDVPIEFLGAKVDDVRVWNTVRTGTQIADNLGNELTGSEAGLAAYWKLNNTGADATGHGSALDSYGGGVYSSDVPFGAAVVGPPGPQGPAGLLSESQIVAGATTTIAANAAVGTLSPVATASCPSGKILLGGGGWVQHPGTARGALSISAPSAANTWSVRAVVVLQANAVINVVPFVVCSQ